MSGIWCSGLAIHKLFRGMLWKLLTRNRLDKATRFVVYGTIHKKNDEGDMVKCCDVGSGCAGYKGCSIKILTKDEYKAWATFQKSRDKKFKEKFGETGSTKVGFYFWAVYGMCKTWCKNNSGGIAMRDGFKFGANMTPNKNRKKEKVAKLETETKPDPTAGTTAGKPATAPTPSPAIAWAGRSSCQRASVPCQSVPLSTPRGESP